jgi:molybdopterin converting factor small subunit
MMTVRIVTYAQGRELLGFSEQTTELAPGITGGGLFTKLSGERQLAPPVSWRLAVDGEWRAWDQPVDHATEICFMPPFSGG